MNSKNTTEKFESWFKNKDFGSVTEEAKNLIRTVFYYGYHHEDNDRLISALQNLLKIYDCQDGRQWTTSSKRRALDEAREAVNKALGTK